MGKFSRAILLGITCIILVGCGAVSKHYKITKRINGKEVEVDVIEHSGLRTIKSKHSSDVEMESSPIFKVPELPPVILK